MASSTNSFRSFIADVEEELARLLGTTPGAPLGWAMLSMISAFMLVATLLLIEQERTSLLLDPDYIVSARRRTMLAFAPPWHFWAVIFFVGLILERLATVIARIGKDA